MSAPVKERPAGTATIPVQRKARPPETFRREKRAGAASKAYARRDDRLRRLVGPRIARAAAPGRTPFVLLVMGLLAVGLVATLWLSTAAAADSYRLTDARSAASALVEQSEQLRRQVATMESAPEIARRAEALGMVPVQDPARLVVAPDGSVTVVGTPRAVSRPAPVVAPAPSAATPAPQATTPATTPAATPTPTPTPTDQSQTADAATQAADDPTDSGTVGAAAQQAQPAAAGTGTH